MVTKSIRNPVEKRRKEELSAPPGFSSLASVALRKRAKTGKVPDIASPRAVESPREVEVSSMPMSPSSDLDASADAKRSLNLERRPWIVYEQLQSEVQSRGKHHYTSLSKKSCLPKGVIRGCQECSDCQKVSARWNPEGAHTFLLEEAPVFYPNKEEFKDIFKYINSIRQLVEPYGLCRIVPPLSWRLPCSMEKSDIWRGSEFSTQIQRVNELQSHCLCGKVSAVHDRWDTKRRRLAYETGDGCAANFVSDDCHGTESCKSDSGPQFTRRTFKRYADYFQQCYFSRDTEVSNAKISPAVCQEEWEPSVENIEGEYWRIIEKPTEEIEVLHCIDVDSRGLGSGSSVSSILEQASEFGNKFSSGWNLNYISSWPGSLLSLETLSSGILGPWLHVGMCFSSLPWTVEEHHLYKLCYLHLGAPRIWYGTSGCHHRKFDAVLKKHFPDCLEERQQVCHKLGGQLSPATLKSEDIPVYRCIQRPREFVLFLPGAYHSGFDCGYNCSTSAVFAPLDWLPHGLYSTELYRETRKKTYISYDKVLLKAADEAIKTQWECLVMGKKTPKNMTWKDVSGKDGILAKALRARIRAESRCREYLSSANQSRKMGNSFDAGDQKKDCSTCYYDLYLSAVNCPCSPNKFSCLKHAKHLCSCPWIEKVFLFRYQIDELNTLLEAVEGKLGAIRSWVKDNLGRALHLAEPEPNDGQYGPTTEAPNERATPTEKDKAPNDGHHGPITEASNVRAAPTEKDKASDSKLPSEASLKGKELATAKASSSSDSSDDTSSTSSLESDIEEYIARLQSREMGNFSTARNTLRESASNRTSGKDQDPLKSFSEAEAPYLGVSGSLKGKKRLKESSDDTSSSSSSELDVDAYIAHLESQRKKNSAPAL